MKVTHRRPARSMMAALLTAIVGLVIFTAAPAQADPATDEPHVTESGEIASSGVIERNGCKWSIDNDATSARTFKQPVGDCEGHAWIRVLYNNGEWSAWKHDPQNVYYPNGATVKSQHKSCGSCKVYELTT